MRRISNQKGVVLILALFFLALATSLSYWMISRTARETRSVDLLLKDIQATSYAYGSLAWAKEELRRRAVNQVPDDLPIKSDVNEVNHYNVYSIITDMQSKFNLNNLSKETDLAQFKILFKLLQPTLSEQQRDEMTQSIIDWISPEDKINSQSYYLTQSPPYRVPHRDMKSISELRLIKGITPAAYDALLPYVTALPQIVKINLLTAEAPVIASLKENMPIETATAIQRSIKDRKIKNAAEFDKLEIAINNGLTAAQATFVSNYFLCETHVTRENQSLVVYTLLERVSIPKNPVSINVIWQSLQVPG